MNSLTLSPAGLALVQRFEGFRAQPERLPDGRWLVGHGHVTMQEGRTFTEAEAARRLKEDLQGIADGLRASVLTPLTQNQFDALVSFAFSIGPEAFKTSDVLRKLNSGEPIAAASAMLAWRRSAASGAVLEALVRRRAAEAALFLEAGSAAAAPSALVRPELDAPPMDDTGRRLGAILAAEPQTQHALGAPIADDDDEEDFPVSAASTSPQHLRETLGFAGLGLFGLMLVALGVGQPGEAGAGVGFLLFAAPGILAVTMAAYYLLKRAAA